MLSPSDFEAFFSEIHGDRPFPWQSRLLREVAGTGRWPAVLDLPTGTGKTAAIDIAVFHLALEAERGPERRAPVRIALVVDRRLVVDDAHGRAQRLAERLATPTGPVSERVAGLLTRLSGGDRPLVACRLRGGIPREGDWARTPSQPTVLCSTVDQIGSRLLFRGYGVSDAMKPVHAGLVGSDCLILLDEAHLAEPFRQTLGWVERYRGTAWREDAHAAPWGVTLLTATPEAASGDGFPLHAEDRSHPTLARRLNAAKPARLIEMPDAEREDAILAEVERAIGRWPAADGAPAVGVVVNRVARARSIFAKLRDRFGAERVDGMLLIGPARPVERDDLAVRLAPIRTGIRRALERPLLIVGTQCIEAGVDIDLDILVTEAAPLDALRQRFGRLNRDGRDIRPQAAVVAVKSEIGSRHEDPVYGRALAPAWEALTTAATKVEGSRSVDFGLGAFAVAMEPAALSPKANAPVLLPAHLDLLSQTSPVPSADPDVALYLHGPDRQPDSVSVIWRADIDPGGRPEDSNALRRLLMLVPPRSTEAIELPLWAVQRWLSRPAGRADDGAGRHLADVPGAAPDTEDPAPRMVRRVFRWRGDDEASVWVGPGTLRPGDTVVVPASYGGVDEFGWNPASGSSATDVGREAAAPFKGRRLAVRVAAGLLDGDRSAEALAEALARAASPRWKDVRDAVRALPLPPGIRADLDSLDRPNRRNSVMVHLDLHGSDAEGRPRGAVFVAAFGVASTAPVDPGQPSATEDDVAGSMPGFAQLLDGHSVMVEARAGALASAAGLPEARVRDLQIAGYLHDAGKFDPRFQAWLHHGDPLGPDPDDTASILAKSGRSLPAGSRSRSGLPDHWRHEALSVRLAPLSGRFEEAQDAELVLWLVGTHHGYGRPFFPHSDPSDGKHRRLPRILGLPADLPPGPGPQSLAFDWNGLDWSSLYARLKARYGVWELARMEAVLRLADHRASEDPMPVEAAE